MASSDVPTFHAYVEPTFEVLRSAERPLDNDAIERAVVERMGLSSEVAAIPHDPAKPGRTEVGYRVAWARTYLKKLGLIDNPQTGAWAVTEKGRSTEGVDGRAVYAEVAQSYRDGSDSEARAAREQDRGVHRTLPPDLASELLKLREELLAEGALLEPAREEEARRGFRARFGPEVLAGLDGEALLLEMHGRGTKDSLVYWLEFKNDEQFPAEFGSIGGGSALKFGIYQSAESGTWLTGSARAQRVLSLDEAVEEARNQRDQLVAGAEVLSSCVDAAQGAIDFSALQSRMLEAAPDVAESSWGHKYFSLLFPALVPPIHGADYQRHQVIKLLHAPGEGRYENDGHVVRAAAELGMGLVDLAKVLDHRNGGPHGYWAVGLSSTSDDTWERMREGGFIAIGWKQLGDLSQLEPGKPAKARIKSLLEESQPQAARIKQKAIEAYRFWNEVTERDVLVVTDGEEVIGIGRPAGDYYFDGDDELLPHRRSVQWLSLDRLSLPTPEGKGRSFVPFGKAPENLVAVEERVLRALWSEQEPPGSAGDGAARPKTTALARPEPEIRRIQGVLQRKGQVILYGPPGTGKTYWAERAAHELAVRGWYRTTRARLGEEEEERLRAEAIEICTFHPSYGYEDFLEGYRPVERDGGLSYELRDGAFKRLCKRAAGRPDRPFYLIIDEINRGDIPRIFGELLTALEKDKRGLPVTLPLSGERWTVPSNVFVIGTMNTADRSIALLDAALRRRFGFVELMPEPGRALGDAAVKGLPLAKWLDSLNARVVEHAGRDARNLQIGHAYLMVAGEPVSDPGRLAEVVRDDIIPLLEEYCYEDFEALANILGTSLVDTRRQRIHAGLFEPDRQEELIEALIAVDPSITATKAAVAATVAEVDDDDEDDAEPSGHEEG